MPNNLNIESIFNIEEYTNNRKNLKINSNEENFNKIMDIKPIKKILKAIIKTASRLLEIIKTNETKILERILAITISMLAISIFQTLKKYGIV